MTLLEVVMAGTVLAIAIMGTMSAWINSQTLQTLQREESIVQAAITKTINDIRALPFTQMDNSQNLPADQRPGYSGGPYVGDLDPYRLVPGKVKLYLGWSGKGPKTDDALRGVKVSPYPFNGAVKVGNSFWAPQAGTPELRVVFINNEWPTEARMGEDTQNPSDGVDLNADGVISETPLASADSYKVEFGSIDSRPLFPRLLAVPVANPPRQPQQGYQNVAQLTIYPIVVQARWWSAAGFSREISVITFVTNRAGSQAPAADTLAN
jgi:hypothetical protein